MFKNLMRMVEHGRVDFGDLDQNVANWVIRNNNLTFSWPLYFISPALTRSPTVFC